MNQLQNSKRLLFTASHVTAKFTPDEQHKNEKRTSGGYQKANLIRALKLDLQDIEKMRSAFEAEFRSEYSGDADRLMSISTKLTDREQLMSNMELAAVMAPITYEAVSLFVGSAIKITRKSELSIYLDLFQKHRSISPIGLLHLERLEMYPAGVEKGELVFTVPMAPGETVTVSHKEWSTSSQEFEEIVQDFFESYSERGVAEKTDASMVSENEAKHSSTLNFGASLTGTYGGVTLTSTFGLANTVDERQSLKNSIQKNREITEKASARSRKEHKVSIKLETKKGIEDSSFRTITNPTTAPVRIDYYRMMRKWRTDLYRYGLRQTYDLTIPLPGVRIWAKYQELEDLDKIIRTPLKFDLAPSFFNPLNYQVEANKVRAVVEDEPPFEKVEFVYGSTAYLDKPAADTVRFGEIDFEIPQGYYLHEALLTANVAVWAGTPIAFNILNAEPIVFPISPAGEVMSILPEHTDINRTGSQKVTFEYRNISSSTVRIKLIYWRRPATYAAWQLSVWRSIRASTEARYQEFLAVKQQERDRLWSQLNNKDTLSLRRLEREELLRLIIQWIMGPMSPALSTSAVEQALIQILANEKAFQAGSLTTLQPTFNAITNVEWSQALWFGDLVKFIQQAIEWENLLYFLFPYFWGSEEIGKNKMLFMHPDPEHEKFLRAGYARIVLTVRPGFEEEFTGLVEEGKLSGISTAPYMPITEAIKNFAKTNYSGIPPANAELHARPLLYPEQRATWAAMETTMKVIEDYKTTNGKYPDKLSDLSGGPYVDFWGNEFQYKSPGLGADFDLISLGEDKMVGGNGLDADISSAAGASLVSTWFDYTPTSAIDIEMDTKPEDIA